MPNSIRRSKHACRQFWTRRRINKANSNTCTPTHARLALSRSHQSIATASATDHVRESERAKVHTHTTYNQLSVERLVFCRRHCASSVCWAYRSRRISHGSLQWTQKTACTRRQWPQLIVTRRSEHNVVRFARLANKRIEKISEHFTQHAKTLCVYADRVFGLACSVHVYECGFDKTSSMITDILFNHFCFVFLYVHETTDSAMMFRGSDPFQYSAYWYHLQAM